MNLKESLGQFFGVIEDPVPEIQHDYNVSFKHTNSIYHGLCLNCNNKPYCVWLENSKNYCEHYE